MASCAYRCLGYSQEGLLNGDCASIATCSSHSCQPGTRCMPKQQTCLSGQNITNEPVCSQYVCGRSLTPLFLPSVHVCKSQPESSAVSCNGVTQEPVCDQSGKEHASMCALLLTNEQMDYTGYCQVRVGMWCLKQADRNTVIWCRKSARGRGDGRCVVWMARPTRAHVTVKQPGWPLTTLTAAEICQNKQAQVCVCLCVCVCV